MQLQNFVTRRESGIESVRRLFEQDDLVLNKKEEESEPSHAFLRKHDWSQLPRDVCYLIAEKAAFRPHLDKFTSTCKEWCTISKEIPPPLMLLLPFNERNNTCRFIGPKEGTAPYDLKMPELNGYWVCGCTNGWLGLINDVSDLVLFNPITHVCVPLPKFTTDRIDEYLTAMGFTDPSIPHIPAMSFVAKLVLSGNREPELSASSSSCLVAIIFRPCSQLAVCQLGDESWTVITTTKKYPRGDRGFHDIVFHNETLYAINAHSRSLYEIHCHRPCGVSIKQIPILFDKNSIYVDKTYIVISSENILFVEKHIDVDRTGTACRPTLIDRFAVFQLDGKTKNWTKVKDLGGRSLFLGLSSSMSISSKELRFGWCKPDCIYFLDDSMANFIAERRGFQCDNGIFSVVKDRVISRLDIQHSLTFWPAPALWYLQNV